MTISCIGQPRTQRESRDGALRLTVQLAEVFVAITVVQQVIIVVVQVLVPLIVHLIITLVEDVVSHLGNARDLRVSRSTVVSGRHLVHLVFSSNGCLIVAPISHCVSLMRPDLRLVNRTARH